MPWTRDQFEIGRQYRRIEPEGDSVWNTVELAGWMNGGESGSVWELVIRPVVFGESPVTASVESFLELYERDEGPRPGTVDAAAEQLAAIAGGDDAS